METRSRSALLNVVWLVAAIVLAALAALILTSAALSSIGSYLFVVAPLSLLVVGPLAAFAYTSASWRLGHRPSQTNLLPAVVAVAQAGTVYLVAARQLRGDDDALEGLNGGGLVLAFLILGVVGAALAGAVAILFLNQRSDAASTG